MENFKEGEDILGVMKLYMRVTSKMAWEMEKDGGLLDSKMGINMKENIAMILNTDMVFINGKMDQNMKEVF